LSAIDTYWLDRCGSCEVIDAATIHHQALVREGSLWRSVDDPEIRHLRENAQQSEERMKLAQEKLTHEIEEKTKLEVALMEKSDELTTFTFKISHELKNNIVAMQKVFEIIDMDPDNVRKYAELIRKNHEKLIRFADELFKLTHAEKIISCEEEIDVESLIRKIFNQASPLDVMTKLSVQESFPTIKADPLAMEVVFSNLISNALRYRDETKKMFSLRVSYRLDGDFIEISFKDNGKGISKGSLNKIFDLNFTTDGNKNFGFGLAIVKKIMVAHRGSVEARSSGTRNGAEFIISLPYAAERSQEEAENCEL
jgi:signal transduction histidine kinase